MTRAPLRDDQVATPASIAEAIAASMRTPPSVATEPWWRSQSLAHGAIGVALLHVERALAGLGSWHTAHSWVIAATGSPINAADDAGLYLGAPALAFVLDAAQADGSSRYDRPLATLMPYITALTHRRVGRALDRMRRQDLTEFAEYDLFTGLTGLGACLLRCRPASDALGRVLGYLVRLANPVRVDGVWLPGWWSAHDPDAVVPLGVPGGHANHGMAHGIAGPLALLARATCLGITVDGQREAIEEFCAHLDAWAQHAVAGTWWPQWITRDDARSGRPTQCGPLRPSWCYGTPGIARALQLAAIATGDRARRHTAERALASCLSDRRQLDRITDVGLCHGWSGLYATAWRASQDALTPAISVLLPDLTDRMPHRRAAGPHRAVGLLAGDAGLALALMTAAHGAAPISGWDTCLLI